MITASPIRNPSPPTTNPNAYTLDFTDRPPPSAREGPGVRRGEVTWYTPVESAWNVTTATACSKPLDDVRLPLYTPAYFTLPLGSVTVTAVVLVGNVP
jgi:hypothetical protein